MEHALNYLRRIVDANLRPDHRMLNIRGFASDSHWKPFAFAQEPADEGHTSILVEHGTDSAALLSFTHSPIQPSALTEFQIRSMLEVSYNSLVDWHLFASDTEVRLLHNRTIPRFDKIERITASNIGYLDGDVFRDFAINHPLETTISACDDEIIEVVSKWKRALFADFGQEIKNKNISALFNALFLLRAIEDEGAGRLIPLSQVSLA